MMLMMMTTKMTMMMISTIFVIHLISLMENALARLIRTENGKTVCKNRLSNKVVIAIND